jgi:hypothetical protein
MAVKETTPAGLSMNPTMLEVSKLYLEKYEHLEPDDRKLFRIVLGRAIAEQGKQA